MLLQVMTNNRRRIWVQRFSGFSDDVKRHLMANYSIPLDRIGLRDLRSDSEERIIHKVFRLGHKLGFRGMSLIGWQSRQRMARFAADLEKFRMRPSVNANYDLSGRPFSCLDDGTFWTGSNTDPNITLRTPNGRYPADPRVAKVKRFLSIHLTREPTDKDVDWFVYTFFGSDAFDDEYSRGGRDLFYGMQDSYYNARGRRTERNTDEHNTWWPTIRRNQRRIRSGVGYNRSTYRYHGGELTNSNSYSNSNSGLGSNSNSNSGLGSNSNSNSRSTRVKKNQNKNNKNKRIQWSKVTLNNAPENRISLEPFSNGNKAVKLSWKNTVGKTHSQYVSPQSFREMARMSMTDAFNKAGNFTLFQNPFTRGMTKRSNVDFVILDLPRTRAATKIQKVVRGSQVRTKIRRNAERATRLASIVQRTVAKKNNKKRATARTARAERKEKLRSKRSHRQ
jgi:hypothetical protein